MESFSSKYENIKYLLCVIDVLTKCVWVKKIKKSKTVLNDFMEIVNESNHKPDKLWADQGREICNKLTQEWLDSNDIIISLTQEQNFLMN